MCWLKTLAYLHRSRHRVGDEAGTEFLEKGDLLADRRFRGVEFRTGRIQVRDDASLFGKRGNREPSLPNYVLADVRLRPAFAGFKPVQLATGKSIE